MTDDNNSNHSNNNSKEEDDNISSEFNDLDGVIKYVTLLNKKTRREPTDIIFNAYEGDLINSFRPNPKELDDFLNNCEIREIKDEKEIINIPKESIFDPKEFINQNYKEENYKMVLTMEDISNLDITKENETQENIKENEEESSLKEPFNINKQDNNKCEINDDLPSVAIKSITDKKGLIKNILNNEILIQKQKEELNKLIYHIENIDISNILQKDSKLDIVFDLDSTCVWAVTIDQEQYKKLIEIKNEKNLKFLNFKNGNKNLLMCLIIRNGLQEFFDFFKNFCNFHISTLGSELYAKEIKKILEDTYKIKFRKIQARNRKIGNKKFLSNLDLDSKMTLIFDDQPKVWKKDYFNVITSKIFIDKEINKYFISDKKDKGSFINFFMQEFLLSYFKSMINDYEQIQWRNQKLVYDRWNPFYYFEEKNKIENFDCYSGEYLDSSKFQFIYMKNVIKIIYFFIFNFNIFISDVIKLIRYNIFYKAYFSLKYYNGFHDGKENLKDIIENCGGQIFQESKNNSFDENDKLFFICKKDDFPKLKDKIKKELLIYKNSKVVNDKYILDSFYFMTNLENELDNSEYSLKIENEDEYDY